MPRSGTHHLRIILLVLAALPPVASASGARQGVKPQPGEIVLLRDVSTRPAYRPAPPGIALIADPSPRRELASALGTEAGLTELSDDEYAAMGSGAAAPATGAPRTTVERLTGAMLVGGTRGGVSGSDALGSGGTLAQGIGVPVGAVGQATRGIGEQVMGALSHFPLGTGAGPGN